MKYLKPFLPKETILDTRYIYRYIRYIYFFIQWGFFVAEIFVFQ